MYGNPTSRPMFSIAGIPVSISWMHFALMAFIAWGALKQDPKLGIGIMIILSFSILFHELGHGLVSRYFRLDPHIELVALGGVCFHKPTSRPRDQFLITAAGPAMNFLLAAIFYFGSSSADGMLLQILYSGFTWNVVLGIYNLLPIFPLDGGVLTLIVARKVWKQGLKADRLVYKLGLGLSVILALAGLGMQMMLVTFVMAYAAVDNWRALQEVQASPERHQTERHSRVRELLEAARKAYAGEDFDGAMRLCHQARAEPFLSAVEMGHIWQILALSAARLSQWQDAARFAARVEGSEEMAQVQAVCVLAIGDADGARAFLASPAAQRIDRAQLESIRSLARSPAEA
ncbi:MAG: site-2 protease family protein [Myxococcales bacterium]|nr:site-2 protease family protein [Myxococcales bacterium]